ncbi:MAG: cohesin domain-containing protein [Acidobacteriota bacterium]
MMRRIVCRAAVAAFVLLASVRGGEAAIITISPSTTNVFVGDLFTVDVLIEVTDLYSYDVEVSFDPTILSATGLTDGGFLTGGFGVFATIDNTAGFTSGADSLTGPTSGVSGIGTLFSIDFTALAVGSSVLSFDLCNSGLCTQLFDSTFADITFTFQNGLANVSARPTIPEPATLTLLGLSLAGAAFRRRSRRAV